jgi:hypothetical protein
MNESYYCSSLNQNYSRINPTESLAAGAGKFSKILFCYTLEFYQFFFLEHIFTRRNAVTVTILIRA